MFMPDPGPNAAVPTFDLDGDPLRLALRDTLDTAPTAVDWCKRRFPGTAVRYAVADVLEPPASWFARFDLVHEAYTLQVLPNELRYPAMARIAWHRARGRTRSSPKSRIPGSDHKPD